MITLRSPFGSGGDRHDKRESLTALRSPFGSGGDKQGRRESLNASWSPMDLVVSEMARDDS